MNYQQLLPYLAKVKEGKYQAFLSEAARMLGHDQRLNGKFQSLARHQNPFETNIFLRSKSAGSHAVRTENFDVFTGDILNLNFPSSVHTMTRDGKEETYGYSSGTYARVNPMFDRVSLLPRQEEIDQVGSGIGKADWEKRFELAYQKALNHNVTATMGVTPVIMAFARYVKKKHGKNTRRHCGSSKRCSAQAFQKFNSSTPPCLRNTLDLHP